MVFQLVSFAHSSNLLGGIEMENFDFMSMIQPILDYYQNFGPVKASIFTLLTVMFVRIVVNIVSKVIDFINAVYSKVEEPLADRVAKFILGIFDKKKTANRKKEPVVKDEEKQEEKDVAN